MTKKQFLKELGLRTRDLGVDERDNLLCYYNELIDDKVDSGISEERVVAELGNIDYIAAKLIGRQVEDKRMSYEESAAADTTKAQAKTVTKSGSKTHLVIYILCFPLILALCALGIALILACAATIFAFGLSGILLLAGGLFCAFASIPSFSESLPYALSVLGSGLLIAGLGMVLIPLLSKPFKYLINGMSRCVKWCVQRLNGRRFLA